jgi:predicted lipid-binding transport protein (Tim44 family)
MLLRFFAAAFWLLALIAVVLVLQPAGAFAQEAATTVAVPIGDWIGKASGVIGSLLGGLVIWLFRQLPAGIVQILRTMQVEQLLDKAITYGINAVAGASKDKVLTVNVGNAVVAQAAQYAIDHAPGWLIGWLGGEAAIRQMIIARLNLEPVATIAPGSTRLMGNG